MPKRKDTKNKKNNNSVKEKIPKENKNNALKILEKDFKELKDKHLRLKAEFENFRRRKADEIAKILQFDGEKVIYGFLPIVDDLNRMIQSANSKEDLLKDGIKMVESKIQKYFESLEIKTFGEIGEHMDAELHDAMLTQKNKNFDDGTILEVFEQGYTYREKVIRHAKVIVNKK